MKIVFLGQFNPYRVSQNDYDSLQFELEQLTNLIGINLELLSSFIVLKFYVLLIYIAYPPVLAGPSHRFNVT